MVSYVKKQSMYRPAVMVLPGNVVSIRGVLRHVNNGSYYTGWIHVPRKRPLRNIPLYIDKPAFAI